MAFVFPTDVEEKALNETPTTSTHSVLVDAQIPYISAVSSPQSHPSTSQVTTSAIVPLLTIPPITSDRGPTSPPLTIASASSRRHSDPYMAPPLSHATVPVRPASQAGLTTPLVPTTLPHIYPYFTERIHQTIPPFSVPSQTWSSLPPPTVTGSNRTDEGACRYQMPTVMQTVANPNTQQQISSSYTTTLYEWTEYPIMQFGSAWSACLHLNDPTIEQDGKIMPFVLKVQDPVTDGTMLSIVNSHCEMIIGISYDRTECTIFIYQMDIPVHQQLFKVVANYHGVQRIVYHQKVYPVNRIIGRLGVVLTSSCAADFAWTLMQNVNRLS